MSKMVLNKLRPEVNRRINVDIFRFSVLGPDPFIFYSFFAPPLLKLKRNRRSAVMHSSYTGSFLTELAMRAKRTTDYDLFSYLVGFLCHYALDGKAHPYVNKLASNDVNRHRAIEKRLDQIELERQGKDIKDRPVTRELFPPFIPERMKTEINSAIESIYGWDDSWSLLKTSYRHMKLFHWIAEDPNGIVDRLFGWIHPKLQGISYRSNVCNDIDYEWFWPVLSKSVEEAVVYIESCYDYMTGTITETELRKIIGNKSYSTGEEIE